MSTAGGEATWVDEGCDGALEVCGLVRVSASNDGLDDDKMDVVLELVVFGVSGTDGIE